MRRCSSGLSSSIPVLIVSHRLNGSASVFDDATTTAAMKQLMDAFAEARELISDARESLGTTYFSDDLDDAIKAKDDVITEWKSVQQKLETAGASDRLVKLQREYDVKFRQLEAEVEELMAHDD
jgi:murein L,D-transpeptidase YcbB/YkuD